MAVTPSGPDPAAEGFAVPDDDVADEDVDVLYLAGQRPPPDGAWLWATTAEARRGGEFTALFLPRNRARVSDGDVLVHIAAGTVREGQPWAEPSARVSVLAVAAGSVIQVASWDGLDLDLWPETIRPATAFAVSALRQPRGRTAPGAGGDPSGQIAVPSSAEAAVAGFPALPAPGRPVTGG